MSMTSRSAPYWAAVASSWPFIRKSPSPATATTGRSLKGRAAAPPAGTPEPLGPEVGRRGHAVPHRAARRRELARHRAVAPVAVPPAGEIAGAVADDGVLLKPLAHCCDAGAEVERDAFPRLRLAPVEPFLVRVIAAGEADEIGVDPLVEHLGELAHVGADRQVGVVDAAELA